MGTRIRRWFRGLAPHFLLKPESDAGIRKMGHRGYVGGRWDEIGQLQFEFLVSKGLKPDSYLLDIACGSLRLGVRAIPYLETSHYLGIEKEKGLVEVGLEVELGAELTEEKRPQIVISDAFDFEQFEQKVDFAIANSLFTHIPSELINRCFSNLWPCLRGDGVFYATFFETKVKVHNPEDPHDHRYFAYTKEEMYEFGVLNGYSSKYIGDWGHPRSQMMVEYRKMK